MKEFLALTATALIIAAYAPYVKDIVRGKTKPHVYSWLISALVTFIAFGLQLSDSAGWGAIPTCVAAVAGLLIFILSLRPGRASITKFDTVFFVIALTAAALWLIADQALLSVILIASVDILAFVPTFRKSWKNPDQETTSTYAVNALRFTLATVAVQHYTFITVLYPLSQAFCDGLFAAFLLLRRHSIAR
ncbi:MAG: hypothetical protein JWO47_930 [Candidatus Saccharibacteria bacterium]|nr:hypothetical protein [Candidatus Saccharibacteria bacterium]